MIPDDIDASIPYYPDHQTILRDLDRHDHTPEPSFDRLTRLAATMMRAPIVLLSLLDDSHQTLLSGVGLPADWAPPRTLAWSLPFCQQILATHMPLAIPDARGHPFVATDALLVSLAVAAYAGVPLVVPEGVAIGTLCAIDTAPRAWTDDDMTALQDIAASAASEIALRRTLAEGRRREAMLSADAARSRTISELTSDYVFSILFTDDGEIV